MNVNWPLLQAPIIRTGSHYYFKSFEIRVFIYKTYSFDKGNDVTPCTDQS